MLHADLTIKVKEPGRNLTDENREVGVREIQLGEFSRFKGNETELKRMIKLSELHEEYTQTYEIKQNKTEGPEL